jgi:probable rRNA maturation factor
VTVRVAWASRLRRPRALTLARIRAAARAALAHGGRPDLELGIVFVDDEELRRMHEHWLDDPTVTDVITFDLAGDLAEGADPSPGPGGELYVSAERARAVARSRDGDLVREHLLYVVHGALHLCGFDDRAPRDRARMRAAERVVLAALDAPRTRGRPRPGGRAAKR